MHRLHTAPMATGKVTAALKLTSPLQRRLRPLRSKAASGIYGLLPPPIPEMALPGGFPILASNPRLGPALQAIGAAVRARAIPPHSRSSGSSLLNSVCVIGHSHLAGQAGGSIPCWGCMPPRWAFAANAVHTGFLLCAAQSSKEPYAHPRAGLEQDEGANLKAPVPANAGCCAAGSPPDIGLSQHPPLLGRHSELQPQSCPSRATQSLLRDVPTLRIGRHARVRQNLLWDRAAQRLVRYRDKAMPFQ